MTVPASRTRRYPEGMSQSTPDVREDMTAMLAAAGIVVTAEGRKRARAKLNAARERLTPQRVDEVRAEVGLPPLPA